MVEPSIKERWDLVRNTSIPRNLRHLLLVLMHYQGENTMVFCRRQRIADELDIKVDVVSQKLGQLEELGIVKSDWRMWKGRPSRQHSIQFSELKKHQRTLIESSDCNGSTLSESSDCNGSSLSESSDCNGSTPSESSESVLANPQSHSERILRHEQPIEQPIEQPSSCRNRFADSDMATAEFLWKLIQDMQPTRKAPKLEKWAGTIRLLRERDGRTDDQIRDLFEWCNRDPFWRTNILSPDKLRDKWDDLQLRRGNPTTKQPEHQQAWQSVLDALRDHSRFNAAAIESDIGPAAFAAAKAVGLRKIEEASAYDRRDLQTQFFDRLQRKLKV